MKRSTTFQSAFRLPQELVDKVDAYAEHLSQQSHGILVSRTDAVRVLLEQALKDFVPAAKGKRGKNA